MEKCNHRFVECDEWGATCVKCGKPESESEELYEGDCSDEYREMNVPSRDN